MSEVMRNAKTEDEARQLWCPMVRYIAFPAPGNKSSALISNRYIEAKCIASGFMMWQWYDTEKDGERVGYCGLT